VDIDDAIGQLELADDQIEELESALTGTCRSAASAALISVQGADAGATRLISRIGGGIESIDLLITLCQEVKTDIADMINGLNAARNAGR